MKCLQNRFNNLKRLSKESCFHMKSLGHETVRIFRNFLEVRWGENSKRRVHAPFVDATSPHFTSENIQKTPQFLMKTECFLLGRLDFNFETINEWCDNEWCGAFTRIFSKSNLEKFQKTAISLSANRVLSVWFRMTW